MRESGRPMVRRPRPGYLGYRDEDAAQPYAHFFEPRTARIQDEPREALLRGMAPTEWAFGVRDLAPSLTKAGDTLLENGWTRQGARTAVAVRTSMPGVEARHWTWWFGWHSRESARYKLWNPDAHRACALAEDRSAERGLSDEEKYVGNVSFVDEYIGGRMQRLAIRFLDPDRLGFERRPGWAHICARVGFSHLPVEFGWLVHQVRPAGEGCEMRSRFVLNEPALTAGSGRSLGLPPRMTSAALPSTIGPDMVYHCAAEMNHLARFLPELYEEFHEVP